MYTPNKRMSMINEILWTYECLYVKLEPAEDPWGGGLLEPATCGCKGRHSLPELSLS